MRFSAEISRRLRRALPGSLLFLFLSAALLQAQPARRELDRYVEDRIFRIPHGFLGIRYDGDITTLTRYNDTLKAIGQSVAQYEGLIPYDLHLTAGTPSRAILLAATAGRARLFSVALDSIPVLAVLWDGTVPPLQKIIGLEDIDRDGKPEAVMVGDSGLAVIGLDGSEKYIRSGAFLDAMLYHGDSLRLISARRISGERISIEMMRPATGMVAMAQEIAGSGTFLMRLIPTSRGDALMVTADGLKPRGFLFNPDTLLSPDQFDLGGHPVAIIPYRNNQELAPAALFRTYPSPTILPLAEGERRREIDYPLGDAFRGAFVTDRYIGLISGDSLALYDRSMHLLAVMPAGGVSDPVVEGIDSTALLLSSRTGSRLITIPEHRITWMERHWILLSAAFLAGILIAALLVTLRRSRFVRTLYRNLVTVPSSHGIIVTSNKQRVKQINVSARTLLEIAPYIPLGRHITEYLVADELRGVLAPLRALFADGEEFEIRIDINHEGAQRALTFRGRPMLGRYGFTAGYLLLVEDVTQTLERERLVNWASVAHHIAHEMKTPLSTVTMTAELLHDRLNGSAAEGEYARATSRIIKQAARLREIVEDLMTVARTESLDKTSTDLEIVFRSMAHDYADTLRGAADLRLEIGGENFRCMVDLTQLTVAIRNLIDNAWQAIGTREGGLIVVGLRETPSTITITVDDNGIGMSRGTLTKLFQPFYTERPGGSGIGTVIVKRVVEAHGGIITVESERGKGTRFTVSLPRS
ncbi:MAG: ATP-binding protein [Candidatus Kapaibacterium sp.]